VTGSTPVPPTIERVPNNNAAVPIRNAALLNEEMDLRSLLEVLLGPEGKRRLKLRNLSNSELFKLYDNEIVLRLHNFKNLADTRRVLAGFQKHLGNYPPSVELAKGFLSQFADRAPRTLYRYSQMVKGFMKWYGEPILDLTIKIPKSLPPYTENQTVDKIRAVISQKKSHKKLIERDLLLVDLAHQSGLRRAELANLLVKHVHDDFIEVRKGKGNKDRNIPLNVTMAERLRQYIEKNHLKPEDKVFGLAAPSIGMKIHDFGKRAGVPEIHAHSLRHKFATDLLEDGTNLKVLQDLLGHENLNTTQVYLSITDKARRVAIEGFEKKPMASVREGDKSKSSLSESNKLSEAEEPIGQIEHHNSVGGSSDRHQNKILPLVKRLRQELRISLVDLPIYDLYGYETVIDAKAGLHRFSKNPYIGFHSNSLVWQVRKGETIHLCYPLELESDSEIIVLRDYLFDHIRSSRYAWLLSDFERGINKWKQLGGQELKERATLLTSIEAKTQEITHENFVSDDSMELNRPGHTKWFTESIWASLIDNIHDNLLYYPVEPLEVKDDLGRPSSLHQAKYGARCIGYAVSKLGAERYQERHKQTMLGFRSEEVSRIKELKLEREKVVREIDEVIAKFVVDVYVPGKCNGCFINLMSP
jgi:site-specific recombinase XerD